MILWNLIVSL